ncbi:hypothetical protein CFP56_014845 [Quercus suber]|uniref:Uncharacterized protein n=1 Tax=Quercus suber TaxID=58331 RepID=A0AAW0KT00_QUESU
MYKLEARIHHCHVIWACLILFLEVSKSALREAEKEMRIVIHGSTVFKSGRAHQELERNVHSSVEELVRVQLVNSNDEAEALALQRAINTVE